MAFSLLRALVWMAIAATAPPQPSVALIAHSCSSDLQDRSSNLSRSADNWRWKLSSEPQRCLRTPSQAPPSPKGLPPSARPPSSSRASLSSQRSRRPASHGGSGERSCHPSRETRCSTRSPPPPLRAINAHTAVACNGWRQSSWVCLAVRVALSVLLAYLSGGAFAPSPAR